MGEKGDVFDKEQTIFDRFVESLDSGACAQAKIRGFVKSYGMLLKPVRRLTKISNRNEMEPRAARQAAESANRAKSFFLSTMSHEIRTPMNGVVGMIDMLRDTPLDDKQRRMLSTVKSSAQSLLHVINDILDFYKIESGRMELEPVDTDLGLLMEEVCGILQPNADEKGVALTVTVDRKLPRYVVADPVRVRQILTNLIGNAIKFTSRNERHSAKSVHVDLKVTKMREKKIKVLLSVQDTGIGMDEAAQENLFTPFTQADATITRRFGGTGSGLAICHDLVRLMGGTISVESASGEGSLFTVWLSLRRAADEGTVELDVNGRRLIQRGDAPILEVPNRQAPNRAQAIADGQLILVAEDNPTNQDVIRRQLSRLGYAADIVHDGKAGFEQIQHGEHAILLTDLHMPEMDGLALTEAVREWEADSDSHLPIVAITANALSGDAVKGLAAGMDAYLTKPIDIGELYRTLFKYLGEPKGEATDPEAATPTLARAVSLEDIGFRLNFLKRNFGDDPGLHRQIVMGFANSSAPLVDKIMTALAADNRPEMAFAAHSLKSASRTAGVEQLANTSETIEKLAKTAGADADTLAAECGVLQFGWTELSKALSELESA